MPSVVKAYVWTPIDISECCRVSMDRAEPQGRGGGDILVLYPKCWVTQRCPTGVRVLYFLKFLEQLPVHTQAHGPQGRH